MFEQYWWKESQTLYKEGSVPPKSHSYEVSGQVKFNLQWKLIFLINGLPADWLTFATNFETAASLQGIRLVAKLSAKGRFYELYSSVPETLDFGIDDTWETFFWSESKERDRWNSAG